MLLSRAVGCALLWLGATTMASPETARDLSVQLPYEKHVLGNGLTVILHQDRTAPLVAVSLWYGVGSKDEPLGKTGLAHLYEHLMFIGSEHFDQEWSGALKETGATEVTGVTGFDYTFYTQTVPKAALDRALWLESDRMGYLLGTLSQDKLDAQRHVVLNEKRRGENEYGAREESLTLAQLFPATHPYGHPTIGSFEDLNAVTLEDIQEWHRNHYSAGNAVLVLAGDIDLESARQKAQRFFGELPTVARARLPPVVTPRLTANRYDVIRSTSSPPKLVRTWVTPGYATREAALLDLANSLLGDGRSSRLYAELVEKEGVAANIILKNEALGISSLWSMTVNAQRGIDRQRLLGRLDNAIETFLTEGPTSEELSRAKARLRASLLRGLEKAGGYRGDDKSAALATGMLYADDPGFISKRSAWIAGATASDVLAAARNVMRAGYHQLEVRPPEELPVTPIPTRRSEDLPEMGAATGFHFPKVEEMRLPNGVRVVLAHRAGRALAEVAVEFDVGRTAEIAADMPEGTASLVSEMLEEEARKRSGRGLSGTLESVGATLVSKSSVDTTGLYLSVLNENLAQSFDILADVIRNPKYEKTLLNKLRSHRLVEREREESEPKRIAERVLSAELYGSRQLDGGASGGSGKSIEIEGLKREHLWRFHETWIRPDTTTVYVVGDFSIAEIGVMMTKVLGRWKKPAAPIPDRLPPVAQPPRAYVVLIDRPNASQSVIVAGQIVSPPAAPGSAALQAMNDILGAGTASRLNENLREDKGWAYFVASSLLPARESQIFSIYAPVQADKTAASILEIRRELREYQAARPVTLEELRRTVYSKPLALPGMFQTSEAVLDSLTESARFGRSWNYPDELAANYRSLDVAAMRASAERELHPEQLVWVVVGDRKRIEPEIRALNLGSITIRGVDAEDRVVH